MLGSYLFLFPGLFCTKTIFLFSTYLAAILIRHELAKLVSERCQISSFRQFRLSSEWLSKMSNVQGKVLQHRNTLKVKLGQFAHELATTFFSTRIQSLLKSGYNTYLVWKTIWHSQISVLKKTMNKISLVVF